MMTEERYFEDFSTAFDYCREADRPVDVTMRDKGRWRLYPSGHAKQLAQEMTA